MILYIYIYIYIISWGEEEETSADDMALLGEDERILMELNNRYEDYGMKKKISKKKAMVIGRKPKKIDVQIKDESVEQVDIFKYLWCNISSNVNCCQEVKQRIAMAKEAFNRKRSIFCGPLEKRTTEVTNVCSVVWCRDLDTTTE